MHCISILPGVSPAATPSTASTAAAAAARPSTAPPATALHGLTHNLAALGVILRQII